MASHLDDTQIYYGYFRVVEQVDKSVTAKFGTLKLMTNNVSPLLRGKVATHAGFIQSLLQPSQVFLSSPSGCNRCLGELRFARQSRYFGRDRDGKIGSLHGDSHQRYRKEN